MNTTKKSHTELVAIPGNPLKKLKVTTTTEVTTEVKMTVVPNIKVGDVVLVRYVNKCPKFQTYVSDSDTSDIDNSSDSDEVVATAETNQCLAIVMGVCTERSKVKIAWIITDQSDIVFNEQYKIPDAWRDVGKSLGVIDTCVIEVHTDTVEPNTGPIPVFCQKSYDSRNGCVSNQTSIEFLTLYR